MYECHLFKLHKSCCAKIKLMLKSVCSQCVLESLGGLSDKKGSSGKCFLAAQAHSQQFYIKRATFIGLT